MATLHINAKCSDAFSASLREAGRPVLRYDGYVPLFLTTDGDNDYVSLDIDTNTGKILNWRKPSKKALAEFKED